MPTPNPMYKPSNPPSTLPPVSYDDPANNRFCGAGWGMAMSNCSFETHCPSGSSDDCSAGHTCHGGLPSPQCNIVDIWEKMKKADEPSPSPTMQPISADSPTNTKFCGKSWGAAQENCSLDTHCPDDKCPKGFICYGGTKCNAFDMTEKPTQSPTLRPTNEPTTFPPTFTPKPTESPTDPLIPTSSPTSQGPTEEVIPEGDMRHSFWCGKDWADVNKKCHEPCTSGQDTECSDSTMKCIAFTNCRPTPKPTEKPTKKPNPQTPRPSLRPTEKLATSTPKLPTYAPTHATYAPSVKDDEVSISSAPSRKPILVLVTNEPTLDFTTNEPTTSSIALNENIPDEANTLPPTNRPSPVPTSKTTISTSNPTPKMTVPFFKPTSKPTSKFSEFYTSNPTSEKFDPGTLDQAPPPSLIAKIGGILIAAKADINQKVLLSHDSVTGKKIPSQRYTFDGFINALGVISKGHLGSSFFYLGQSIGPAASPSVNYGLVNVALLLSQAVLESIKYDVCDEVSWERDVFGRYPLANSCGQGHFAGVKTSYDAANQCSEEESFLACPVDPSMTVTAESRVIWEGAPPPLQCFPATNGKGTGAWDSTLSCTADGCNYYDGQVKGNIDPNSIPASNSFGRKNVEGCCWWGRGAIPRGSAGTCMIGKLNYYLGKRAHDDGRSSARYKELDFCKDPGVICRGYYNDIEKNAEIRWMMGILYWIRHVQTYNKDGFSFMERLIQFVDSGLREPPDFFDDVSRIVSRGCHQRGCGNVIAGTERKQIFDDIILYFGNAQAGSSFSKETPSPTNVPSTKQPIKTITPTTSPTTQNPTKSDSASHPTSLHVTPRPPEHTSEEVTHLSMEELKHRMNVSNNYCATSLEEVDSKCATTLRTCNFGEPLCTVGEACFGNIPCPAAAQFITQEEEDIPIKEDNPISCGDACLRPLSSQECRSGIKMGAFVSLPSCTNVRIGEFCKSNGECSGAANVKSNCPDGRHVFMRVNICNSSQNSVTATADETPTATTQDQTANTPIKNERDNSTVLTEPTEQQEVDIWDSSLKTWWKKEFNNGGSIRAHTCLTHILSALATILIIL